MNGRWGLFTPSTTSSNVPPFVALKQLAKPSFNILPEAKRVSAILTSSSIEMGPQLKEYFSLTSAAEISWQ